MRVLILGGTEFVGRALVEAAVMRGDDVTVLNRGTHAADPRVRSIVADRRNPDTLADALAGVGERWDAVVDTWSWEPYVVRDTARLLEPLVDRYLYVSTRSVYADPLPAGSNETAPVVEASSDDGDPAMGQEPAVELDYPRLKRGAELAVEQTFGDRGTLIRAGLILGPYENIGRLPWWLARMARGGAVLAPGRPEYGIQLIDARDLAAFALHLAATRASGAFDAVSPTGHFTMGELLDACARTAGGADDPPRLTWVSEDRLLAAGIQPWMQLPIWLPQGEDHAAMHESDVAKAVGAGMAIRPLQDTVADTWSWLSTIGGTAPQRPDRPVLGLDPAIEDSVLAGRR